MTILDGKGPIDTDGDGIPDNVSVKYSPSLDILYFRTSGFVFKTIKSNKTSMSSIFNWKWYFANNFVLGKCNNGFDN